MIYTKYIVLIVIAILVLIWPFVKRLSKRKRHSDIISEALRNQRERNQAHLRRFAEERQERQRAEDDRMFEELKRRRDEFIAEHERPKNNPIEFLKKEDFEI